MNRPLNEKFAGEAGRVRKPKLCRAFVFACVSIFLCITQASANNLRISNVTLAHRNKTGGYSSIKFNMSWDNSWRHGNEYDAIWVFAKYKIHGETEWRHVYLRNTSGTKSITPAGFLAGTGTAVEIVVPGDGTGCFVERSTAGTGTASVSNVEIVWNWGAEAGLDANKKVQVKVLGIEMVHIPSNTYAVGDVSSGGVTNSFYTMPTPSVGYTVASEGQITVGTAAGSLNYNGAVAGAIPAAFPKGYNAFYIMKYEISENQYVDFLNMLSPTQGNNRYSAGNYGQNRYKISVSGSVYSSNGRGARACNYLSWQDLCAYADWAGLRPMTEFEYECAARASSSVTTGEYAWGNATIVQAQDISGTEDGTEYITTPKANCCYGGCTFSGGDGGTGPLRVGIFARSDSVTLRSESGAGHEGCMELSGNVWEQVVAIYNGSAYSTFAGSNGNGTLSANGCADNSDWPGYDGAEVTGAVGAGLRGGSWATAADRCRVADRNDIGTVPGSRNSDYGGRLVRTE